MATLTERILQVMNNPNNIRNIGIIAHIHHGKTTLTDSLLAGAGMLAEELAGEAMFTWWHETEREREITVYGAAVSMVHNYENQDYLINLIDTPGHVEFSGQVTRAIRSTYQGSRFQRICKRLNLWCFNPLWLKDEKEYLYELLKNNFQFIIVGWYTYPLDTNILGKIVDENIIKKLIEYKEKYKINIAGEGGEYETFVLYQPLFRKRIIIKDYEIKIEKNYAEYIISDAYLE